MNRAFCRDLHQLRVLRFAQWSRQFDFNVNSVEHALLGFAFLAVNCVDARMRQRNCDVFERKFFSARVETDGHGCADAEARQQIIVGIRAGIAAAHAQGFIGGKAMFTCNNLLLETAHVAAHDNVWRFVVALCSHKPDQGRRMPANASRYRQTRKTNKIDMTLAIGRPLGSIKM